MNPMGNGFKSIGSVSVLVEDVRDGNLKVRERWTSSDNFVELALRDPERPGLLCLQLSQQEACQLADLLREVDRRYEKTALEEFEEILEARKNKN
jgi:hypothetical protein